MLGNTFVNSTAHPLDIVESLASDQAWEFKRSERDSITMEIEGLWRTYYLTLSWSAEDAVLSMICSFEITPTAKRKLQFYETINLCNIQCNIGSFSYWDAQKHLTWRHSFSLTGEYEEDIYALDRMMSEALIMTERFYPAFQLATWGNKPPSEAIQLAITETYGHA